MSRQFFILKYFPAITQMERSPCLCSSSLSSSSSSSSSSSPPASPSSSSSSSSRRYHHRRRRRRRRCSRHHHHHLRCRRHHRRRRRCSRRHHHQHSIHAFISTYVIFLLDFFRTSMFFEFIFVWRGHVTLWNYFPCHPAIPVNHLFSWPSIQLTSYSVNRLFS